MENSKFDKAIHDAQRAFWNSIVKSYPKITTGDIDPLESVKFHLACERILKDWLKWNKEPIMLDDAWDDILGLIESHDNNRKYVLYDEAEENEQEVSLLVFLDENKEGFTLSCSLIIMALDVGESYREGGGAAPIWEIKRIK